MVETQCTPTIALREQSVREPQVDNNCVDLRPKQILEQRSCSRNDNRVLPVSAYSCHDHTDFLWTLNGLQEQGVSAVNASCRLLNTCVSCDCYPRATGSESRTEAPATGAFATPRTMPVTTAAVTSVDELVAFEHAGTEAVAGIANTVRNLRGNSHRVINRKLSRRIGSSEANNQSRVSKPGIRDWHC